MRQGRFSCRSLSAGAVDREVKTIGKAFQAPLPAGLIFSPARQRKWR